MWQPMTPTCRSVRREQPELFRKIERNHFAESNQKALYGALRSLSELQVVDTTRGMNPLHASLWASQRQTAYRFGWINAVFNPRKVLLGDDPECVTEEECTWL